MFPFLTRETGTLLLFQMKILRHFPREAKRVSHPIRHTSEAARQSQPANDTESLTRHRLECVLKLTHAARTERKNQLCIAFYGHIVMHNLHKMRSLELGFESKKKRKKKKNCAHNKKN